MEKADNAKVGPFEAAARESGFTFNGKRILLKDNKVKAFPERKSEGA